MASAGADDQRSAAPDSVNFEHARARGPHLRIFAARGLRGVVDGTVSVILAGYLTALGLSAGEVGAVVTATMLGSAALTIAVGLAAHRLDMRRVLLAAALLMVATGLGFAGLERFWPLLVLAAVGTLNPSSGDVSVFLPLEQATLAAAASGGPARAALFAWYNVVGTFAGALGALGAGLPQLFAAHAGLAVHAAQRAVFLVYAACGLLVLLIYLGLPPGSRATSSPARPLARSRAVVLRLAALFSLDSFGGGFVVQSLLALWLFRRFDLSVATAGTIFFASSLAGALSQFLSPRLARRIGLVRTMVYTHLPANLLLVAAGLMPRLELAVACLILRASVSSMDVPARQAYVMAVVPPEERAAAASVTNVPRSLAAAIPPVLTGLMLERTSFGWPLIIAGALKATYDLLLLAQFRSADVTGETS
jgi:MFS family permease